MTAGRVGRPHGTDGASTSSEPSDAARARHDGRVSRSSTHEVARRAGTDAAPAAPARGVDDRDAAAALRGEPLLGGGRARLEEGEYLVDDLVGLRGAAGLGDVRAGARRPVLLTLLEVGEDGTLVPLVADAVRSIDRGARIIEVDRGLPRAADEDRRLHPLSRVVRLVLRAAPRPQRARARPPARRASTTATRRRCAGQVDDTPYGGGAGMVIRVDVVDAALAALYGATPPSPPGAAWSRSPPAGRPLRRRAGGRARRGA